MKSASAKKNKSCLSYLNLFKDRNHSLYFFILIFLLGGSENCRPPLSITPNGVTQINTDYYKRKKVDLLSVKSCEGCHVQETKEWRLSGHGRAWTNPVFLNSFQKEPAAWCVNCHAPIDKQRLQIFESDSKLPGGRVKIETTSNLTREGVNCAVCHVRDGKIYASKKPSASSVRLSIHPIEVDTSLSKPEFCASCHEFPFPKQTKEFAFSETPMQSTLSEFFKSPAHKEGKTCQSCHFWNPKENTSYHGNIAANTENFPIQLQVDKKDKEYAVTLQLEKIGHAWPTGDLFRQLRLRIKFKDGKERQFFQMRAPISIAEPRWGPDFRLSPESNGITAIYNLGQSEPIHCTIEIHKQGGIESSIRREINFSVYQTEFVRNIYSGSCNFKSLTQF